jgi:hypothetical protein
VVVTAVLCVVCGCMKPGDSMSVSTQITPNLRIPRHMDISGTVQRNEEIGEAARAVTMRVAELDIRGLNETIVEMNVILRELRARVLTIPEAFGTELGDTVRDARLSELTAEWRDVASLTRAKMEAIDAGRINGATEEIRHLAVQLSQQLQQIDTSVFNQAVADSRALLPELRAALLRSSDLMADLQETINSLPIDHLTASLNGVELAAGSAGPFLDTVTRLLWILAASIILGGIWLLVFLNRVSKTQVR